MPRYDLAKFKQKPEKKYLTEETDNIEKNVENKNEVKQQSGPQNKGGRKMKGEEPINKRFSIAFTELEYNTLSEKAGRIPMSVFIRDILREAGVI